MNVNESERAVAFEIREHIGIITPYPTGWAKELNLVAWNGGTAKFDIRDWNQDHEHMSRGITLHRDEMKKVMELLQDRDL